MRAILIAWWAWLQAWAAFGRRRANSAPDEPPRDVRVLEQQGVWYRDLDDAERERPRPRRSSSVSSTWAGLDARRVRREALRRRFR